MTQEEEAIKYLQDVKYPKVNYDDVLALQRCMIVEPKFKVGDWITNGRYVKLIVGINSDCLCYIFKDGTSQRIKDIDEKYHLWTIQDAKNGDVLYTSSTASNEVFIFKGLTEEGYIKCYCSYDSEDKYCEGKYHFIGKPDFTTRPATKEQRDLLFSKMKEAGYEWDDKKKELKEIEQKPKEKYEWSEEDENMIEDIIEAIDTQYAVSDYNDMVSWLKSLKERMKGDKQ